MLDITASCEQRDTVVDMVRKVAANVFIPFTVGGGIRTVDDFKRLLREGADKISVNSAVIDRPELIREAADKFGSQCVVVAIDAKRRPDGGWNIYKHGGRLDTGIDAIGGRRSRSSWCRRNSPYQHGLRWNQSWLRHPINPCCIRCRIHSRHCLGGAGTLEHFTKVSLTEVQTQYWQHLCFIIKNWKFLR